jgi:hypothetical protein
VLLTEQPEAKCMKRPCADVIAAFDAKRSEVFYETVCRIPRKRNGENAFWVGAFF